MHIPLTKCLGPQLRTQRNGDKLGLEYPSESGENVLVNTVKYAFVASQRAIGGALAAQVKLTYSGGRNDERRGRAPATTALASMLVIDAGTAVSVIDVTGNCVKEHQRASADASSWIAFRGARNSGC